MKKSFLKIISLFLVMTFVLSGCAIGGGSEKEPQFPEGKEAQAVVAFNPVFYLDGESVVAFNDINTSIATDAKAQTLTSLSKDTSWKWISKSGSEWKLRNTYALDKWRNRASVSDNKLKAYSYTQDGTVSVMCYNTSVLDVKTYNGNALPDAGLLLSTSGDRQEGISYVVGSDGSLEIPAGTLTMVKSVGGIETGFLDNEDGSIRTAVVNIMINNTVLWSGEFGKGVGENGEDVTLLEYPAFYDLPVKEGNIITFGIQLNGELADEIYGNNTDNNDNIDNNDTTDDNDDAPIIDEVPVVKPETKDITFIDGYNSRFEVVYPENASIAVQKLGNNTFTTLEKILEASVRLKTDNTEDYPASEYEILIGETNRAASKEAYSALKGYRKNYANDYIVKVAGKHVVIAAGSETALEKALDFFLTTYLKDDNSAVPADMYHVSRPKVEALSIGGVDVSKYVIRTEKYPSILTKRAAKNLANFFIETCGITIPVENDQKTSANEILVGFTERSGIDASVFKRESLDYVNGYAAEQYKVFYKDGKLFIDAGSDYAANYATGLVMNQLSTSKEVPATFTKSGVYNTADDSIKYGLSDGYGLAWSDEFLSSTIDGTPIDNKLDYWTDIILSGGDSEPYVAYKPDSKLVTELLELDITNPLRSLLGSKTENKSYGEYYPFGKMYQGGFGKTYGVKNNLLYQTTKFDTSTGFWRSCLDTKKSMSFRYGIFEVRQIVGSRKGASASLWFTAASGLEDGCEIDIYETFGGSELNPNLHTWANYNTNHTNHDAVRDFIRISAKPPVGENFYDAFHYIGMEWNADYLDFYLDGEIFCAVPMTDEKWYAFEQKIAPEMDLAVVGGFYAYGNYPGDSGGIQELLNFEVTQYTDYVRIFQKNGERQRVWDYLAD